MMIVKSPLKKKKVRPNRRKRPGGGNGAANRVGSNGNGTRRAKKNGKTDRSFSLSRVSPWKLILGAVVLGILGVLYLNHVFATQNLLHEVQQLEQEYNEVKRAHTDYRLTYDRLTGPADIYRKAKEQGFINGGPADRVIVIDE